MAELPPAAHTPQEQDSTCLACAVSLASGNTLINIKNCKKKHPTCATLPSPYPTVYSNPYCFSL